MRDLTVIEAELRTLSVNTPRSRHLYGREAADAMRRPISDGLLDEWLDTSRSVAEVMIGHRPVTLESHGA
jgi:hypothetical protein